LQAKLHVGPANDPLEHEADRVADAVVSNQALSAGVVSGGNGIQRKCAECAAEEHETIRLQREDEEDEELRMKPESDGARSRSAAATQTAADAVTGGGGRLPPGARSYFEPRFGQDFTGVRIHTGRRAQQAAGAIGARAYTLGRDIAFAAGQYDPQSPRGRHLLAHELTHVVQQQGGSGFGGTIRRRLAVDKPTANIPNPGGKGIAQTNADTIEQYLSELCPDGTPKVDKAGDVMMSSGLCSKELVGPSFMGPLTAKQQRVKTLTGCTCLCDMIGSANLWKIFVDDTSWPHTRFDDDAKAHKKGSGGSGGLVTTPSPNSDKLWGATTKSGADLNIDPWLVLGHELCGHAWLGDRGEHAPDKVAPRGSGGHQATVKRENLIRQEHGIEERGGYRDPYCGESFWRDKANPGGINRSGSLKECERWRKEYNKKHGTKYTLKDRIP
jgi:hypothetical protein